ncbi:tRNA lysidine(34) synthetase TilS [Vibrio ezurae]|uniref:tRNA lysidine(34) synthetase TilS n=1 Tax=Vibrio ezurae TaxID=252583 RepID=UPI0005925836|nr:tRNA lysidine(34) synthetase TilS [Vibrio ezurae]
MDIIFDTFCKVIEAYRRADSKIVLALSGGLDSRVMLHCLARYRAQNPTSHVIAVHVNHGLSQNAPYWTAQCQQWCDAALVPFFVEHAHLDRHSKQSLEAQAREARYELLAKHLRQGDLLLTAQHADDQLETLLLALKRGSGPRGLAGMGVCSVFNDSLLVRPFLSLLRQQLHNYAKAHTLEWVEDESNQDTQFDRNFLRHEVVAKLSSRWPEIQKNALRSAELCFEQEQLLDELLQHQYEQALNPDRSLCIERLSAVSEAIRHRLLRQWFKHHHLPMPSRKQLSLLFNEVISAAQDANPKLVIGCITVRRFQNSIHLVEEVSLAQGWQSALRLNERMELPHSLGCVTVSDNSEFGLGVRMANMDENVWVQFNPSGLSAHPEGRVGSRKLKKLFQEYQIPPWKRSQIPILMYNDKVVAVGDLFVCRDFTGSSHRFYWEKIQSTR